VFRATVVSIALTFALGQNAGLVCQVWCEPHEAAGSACHHEATGFSLLASDMRCDNAFGAAAVLPLDSGKESRTLDLRHAVLVSCHQLVRPTVERRLAQQFLDGCGLEKRPLMPALRI
jgi:hypothetical protein